MVCRNITTGELRTEKRFVESGVPARSKQKSAENQKSEEEFRADEKTRG
jgi:hypothetical protein